MNQFDQKKKHILQSLYIQYSAGLCVASVYCWGWKRGLLQPGMNELITVTIKGIINEVMVCF